MFHELEQIFTDHQHTVAALEAVSTFAAVVVALGVAFFSLRANRKQTRLDQRAWIATERIYSIPDIPEIGKTLEGIVRLKNSGKTPAKNIVITARFDPVNHGITPDFSYKNNPCIRGGILAPGAGSDLPFGPLNNPGTNRPLIFDQQIIAQILNKQIVIYLHGRVEYDDIFGCHHWLTFCSLLEVPFSGQFAFTTYHNDTGDGPAQG